MGTSLFGGKPPAAINNPPPSPLSSVRVQSSVQGKPRGIGYGATRISANLIWYGNFASAPVYSASASGGGGGKGSMFGTGGSASAPQLTITGYTYSAAILLALGEGPVATPILACWNSKSLVDPEFLGLGLFVGSYAQTAWSYITTTNPTQALAYRGTAYMGSNMPLGTSTELPNVSVEILFAINSAYSGTLDADPKDIVYDFLTNAYYGIGFPASRIATNTAYSQYCIASELVMSPYVNDQRPGSDYLKQWCEATNSEFVWSSGALSIVPYGDQDITAHGQTYTAPVSPQYDLTDSDFIVTSDPVVVKCERRRVEDACNAIKIEYLGTTDIYTAFNPAIVEVKDDAAIQVYGLKARSVAEHHEFTQLAAAQLSASLLLGREQIRNTYQFTVSAKYILLDPMDLITITDAGLGLSRQFVRIKEITENDDYSLTMLCEEYLSGTGNAPVHGDEANAGVSQNYNEDPGNVDTPFVFEPTDSLSGGGVQVWGAVTGLDLTVWGGCEVWWSLDGATYALVPGTVFGPSRMGTLATAIGAVTASASGVTIDTGNTMEVDLSISQGTLSSGTADDLNQFTTLVYVDSEFMAYENSTPVSTYVFDLNPLARGGYGSTIAAHSIGARFVRVDNGVFRAGLTADKIGQTLYFKFLSFNRYGGGKQALADVGAYSYVVVGPGVTSPLPDVDSFTSVYSSNVTQLSWNEILDARSPILYEIRKGTDWDTGVILGRYAHPPVPTVGDGIYHIKALYVTADGVEIYSLDAVDLSITGSVLPLNTKAQYDEIATMATGTFYA